MLLSLPMYFSYTSQHCVNTSCLLYCCFCKYTHTHKQTNTHSFGGWNHTLNSYTETHLDLLGVPDLDLRGEPERERRGEKDLDLEHGLLLNSCLQQIKAYTIHFGCICTTQALKYFTITILLDNNYYFKMYLASKSVTWHKTVMMQNK